MDLRGRICDPNDSLPPPHHPEQTGGIMAGLTRVEAYYNLHRGCISYRPIGGRVSHAAAITLADATFSVQPAGRERVRREGRKNVHAFVRGLLTGKNESHRNNLASTVNAMSRGARRITYNPYLYETFVYADTEEPVFHPAGEVWIIDQKIWEVPK